MNLDEIQDRREVLAGANWSFMQAPGPDPNDWRFGGSREIVDALVELPDDVDTLLARVRELEGALTFYADPDLYEEWTDDGAGQIVVCPPKIMYDRGEHAMAALAGELDNDDEIRSRKPSSPDGKIDK